MRARALRRGGRGRRAGPGAARYNRPVEAVALRHEARLSVPDAIGSLLQALGSLSFRGRLLAFATLVVAVELSFRRLAPRSRAYRAWTRGFEAVGAVWTGVLLALVYFLSVSLVSLGMRLLGKDPLDRALAAEPSFWRPHEPNPLGPRAASRHQF